MRDIGRVVKQKRADLGERQADIAEICGVGTRFLSDLESGKETAEIGKVIQVLQRMGLDVWIVPRNIKLLVE